MSKLSSAFLHDELFTRLKNAPDEQYVITVSNGPDLVGNIQMLPDADYILVSHGGMKPALVAWSHIVMLRFTGQ